MNTKIKVSGNIIGELSEKIPSNIIALNELIKNSYDAGANEVNVTIDTVARKLFIKDDGSGMDTSDIETLFHISSSKKKYGVVNKYGRYTQGSKGLGFLSVFKFGNNVKWRTYKNEGLEFSVDYNELVKLDDISDYDVTIYEDNEIRNGTEIEIDLDVYNIDNLPPYLNQEKNYEKIINAFDDDKFVIELKVDDKTYSNIDKLKIKKFLPERQLYYVTFSSEEQKIKFYYKDMLLISKKHDFLSVKYKLNLELLIFMFKPNDKSKINQLFYDNIGDLTPITYINDNLFNNYELFNPGIFKNKRSSDVLNQIIGYIRIISDDSNMAFNSDRSQFLQNELTDEIKKYLNDINMEIQKLGVEQKKSFKINGENFLKSNIKYEEIKSGNLLDAVSDDNKFKEFIEIEEKDDRIIYRLFENEQIINKKNETIGKKEEVKFREAIIKLKNDKIKLEVNTTQYNLYNEILSAKDGLGKDIKDEVKIYMGDVLLNNGILESSDKEGKKTINFVYIDPDTGRTSANLTVEFFIPSSSMRITKRKEKIIQLDFLKQGYTLNYNNYVEKINAEINDLSDQFDKYKELISCSLRAIFEISADCLRKSTKYNSKFYNSDLKEEVKNVIQYLLSNPKYLSAISNNTGIGYKDLQKILNVGDYESAVDNAHMGAHKSSMNITDSQIKDLAKKAGYFMAIVNEMINNANIQ